MRRLKTLIEPLRRIPRQPYAKCLYAFLLNTAYCPEDEPGDLSYLVNFTTDIRVYRYRGHIKMEITTHRPGLYIGAYGRTIDQIQEHISDYFNKEIRITLKEPNFWRS